MSCSALGRAQLGACSRGLLTRAVAGHLRRQLGRPRAHLMLQRRLLTLARQQQRFQGRCLLQLADKSSISSGIAVGRKGELTSQRQQLRVQRVRLRRAHRNHVLRSRAALKDNGHLLIRLGPGLSDGRCGSCASCLGAGGRLLLGLVAGRQLTLARLQPPLEGGASALGPRTAHLHLGDCVGAAGRIGGVAACELVHALELVTQHGGLALGCWQRSILRDLEVSQAALSYGESRCEHTTLRLGT